MKVERGKVQAKLGPIRRLFRERKKQVLRSSVAWRGILLQRSARLGNLVSGDGEPIEDSRNTFIGCVSRTRHVLRSKTK